MCGELKLMKAFAVMVAALLMWSSAGSETFVLPVVARGVPGINGSVWDSEVRISGPNLSLPGPVQRVWVALPEGGFVDDPATAPRWVFPPPPTCAGLCLPVGFVVLTGDQLLQGVDASKGAVALQVEGTGNQVFLHNSNTLGQPRLPQGSEGPACCLPGNGQLVRGLTVPLVGTGFIPWITAGRSPYRVSVGVINPTPQARTITIDFHLAGPYLPVLGTATYFLETSFASLAIDLAPWGFRQVDNLVEVMLQQCPTCGDFDHVAPAGIFVFDDTGLPFYAYASVIWTPLNDPEFIAAEPFAQ
jgi:hypothetical protein